MIRLLIKGQRADAEREASKRGISLDIRTDRERVTGWRETIADVADEHDAAVTAWYCEAGEAPFPDGTLLFYAYDSGQPSASSALSSFEVS